jgi:hypothetical protein
MAVSSLAPSQSTPVQFTGEVVTKNTYTDAPTLPTKKIPFVLYPKSTVSMGKTYSADFSCCFANKTAPGLPAILAYYNKELTARHWKTSGLKNAKSSHVSFNATKGKKFIRGEAWGFDDYCKLTFEVDED